MTVITVKEFRALADLLADELAEEVEAEPIEDDGCGT